MSLELLLPSGVSLDVDSPASEKDLAQSRIIVDGHDTGRVVPGEILEAAVQWNDGYILFVTDNTPFEEHLRIYLFDTQWKIIDSATLGAMYSTGIFADLELAPPASLRFRFFGGITWTLELLDRAILALPFSDPKGVSRPPGLFKRFKIHGHPLPNIAD